MVLQALEFSDCLLDSPHFRDNLNAHEKELDTTSKLIKKLIQEGKDLIQAARRYATCQRNFAHTLLGFQFETIGSQQTDDEKIIGESFRNFGQLIMGIEDARDTMLENTQTSFVERLDEYRKQHIAKAKEEKRRFEKTTKQYCAALEKHLSLKPTKTADGAMAESERGVDQERQAFNKQAMAYTMKLQEVQETKKFEFLETLLSFMLGWKTFYHQGYEVAEDMDSYMKQLSEKLLKTRDNFDSTRDEAMDLMHKMLENSKTKCTSDMPHTGSKMFTRQGYLYLQEKKALGTIGWTKFFCSYQKDTRLFTMIPYNQSTTNASKQNLTPDTKELVTCVRRASDSIDRRFCFDITVKDREEKQTQLTLQSSSDADRHGWLEAMDGKEPVYAQPVISKDTQEFGVDNVGSTFVHKCIEGIETRGLSDQGLYRVVGVSSKVQNLLTQGLEPNKLDKINLTDPECGFEVKTMTSALKTYFKKLSEPLLTFRLHQRWIASAKLEDKEARVAEISQLVHKLPEANLKLLKALMFHLDVVASKQKENLMGASNLSVCFGPTLLRPEEETMAAIMDIKFCNVVIEILIENCHSIFGGSATTNGTTAPTAKAPMRQKPAVPVKNISKLYEEGTYGKLRTSYRQPSIFSNPNYGGSSGTVSPPTRPAHTYKQASNNNEGETGNSKRAPGSTSAMRSSASSNESSPKSDIYPHRSGHRNTAAPQAVVTPQRITPRMYANLSHSALANINLTTNTMSQSYAGTSNSNSPHTQGEGIPGPGAPLINRRVRTLYACDAENETELSFGPGQIIYNVKESREPGWLEGTLNGTTGLLPANYVEYL